VAKHRLLVVVLARNAATSIEDVIRGIPSALGREFDGEILVIDDASADSTFGSARQSQAPFPVRVLANGVRQGYGGSQKLGLHYAVENSFDYVAVIPGNGQYPPASLPALLRPLLDGSAAAVLGSRRVHARFLTRVENSLLRSHIADFHCGYRAFAVGALRSVPFERNSNGFEFDMEIVIQLSIARQAIVEFPIQGGTGNAAGRLRLAWKSLGCAAKARLQEMSLFFDRRFDCAPAGESPYQLKLGYASPHTMALERIPAAARVLDLGSAGGYMGTTLKSRRGCYVSAVDINPPHAPDADEFRLWDLNLGVPAIPPAAFDFILMLDVIEHLARPEDFLEELRRALAATPTAKLLLSTGNVGCFITRLMLLIGQFNYGKRGILDATHTRLFTFGSLRRALHQAGFTVLETKGVPPPYPLAMGDNGASRALLGINHALISLWRGLFSYQIFVTAQAQPTLECLLRESSEFSRMKAESITGPGTRESPTAD
jgi:2-polyprenyl-3-methyl-5-hydroxy-6-metoxy-1,4-benzoquinol methylase